MNRESQSILTHPGIVTESEPCNPVRRVWTSTCGTSWKKFLLVLGLLAAMSCPSPAAKLRVAEAQTATGDSPADSGPASSSSESSSTSTSDVTIEASPEADRKERKDVPWLGISTTEASEALAAQLDLAPGVGLVVNYVASGSPAQKSGLQKNDVLVQFDNQSLVHPAQLRKLVRVHQGDNPVELQYYRAGKRQTVSLKLGLTRLEQGALENGAEALKGNLKDLHKQLRDLHLDETMRDQMRILRESLGNIKIDQKEVQEDVRRGMEEARKVIEQAVRTVTNAEPLRKVMENLAHAGVIVDNKADVTVSSSGKNVSSVIKSDDSGTIVLLSNPKLHLTAHDKEGKLLFDGPIESAEERAKVPEDLWKKVEPLLDQIRPSAEPPEKPEKENQ